MNKKKFFFSLIFIIGLFNGCEKRLFKKVHVKGKVINYFTGSALEISKVELRADDATSAKESQLNLFVFATDSILENGQFEMESKACRRNRYYIRVYENHDPFGIDWVSEIQLNENGTNDLGELKGGKKSFFCIINLIPISRSSISFYNYEIATPSFSFEAGTNSQLILKNTYDKNTYEQNNHNFNVNYTTKLSNINTAHSIKVPITTKDTVMYNIEY